MKTLKYFLFVLVVLILVPDDLQAQTKEIPVTTPSKEALKFFLDGREKFDNVEYFAAALLFDKAIQADTNFARAYLYRAQSGGGYIVARKNLDKAISLIGKVSEGEKLEIQYIQAYSDGNGQAQKECLDKLLASFPSDKRVQLWAGLYYYSINDFSNALMYSFKSAELDNDFASAYNMIGYCQSALNNYKEAEKAFQAYVNMIPEKGNPYDSYAELLMKMGKYDESIAAYKKAVDKDPVDFASSLNGIGDNYIFKGDYVSAREFYQDYFDKAPSNVIKLAALFSKAISYIYEGNIENAIRDLDEYCTMAEKENLVSNAIMSYIYQCYVYSESGNPAEGVKYYNKAIDLLMKSNLIAAEKENLVTTSMRWHIYSLASNNELDKAAKESEKYRQKVESRKNPGEIMNLNSISGFLEIRKGNYSKAIEYFSKANLENPWDWYYTAIAYKKKGESQSAFKLFYKIVKYNVNSIDLALVRKRAEKELKK